MAGRAQLDTNAVLSDLQAGQILAHLAGGPFPDPDKVLHVARVLAARQRHALLAAVNVPVWQTAALQAWTAAPGSALLAIQGATAASRLGVRAFLANTVACVREARVPALWVLPAATVPGGGAGASLVDLLKHLTHQALQQRLQQRQQQQQGLQGPVWPPPPTTTERDLALACARVQSARDEREWFGLLAAHLAPLSRVYVVVDASVLSPLFSSSSSSSSPSALLDGFETVFRELQARACRTVVKALLAGPGTDSPGSGPRVVRLAREPQTVRASRAAAARQGPRGGAAARGSWRRGMRVAMSM